MKSIELEETKKRLDLQHEELLRKIDELDKRIQVILSEWTRVDEQISSISISK